MENHENFDIIMLEDKKVPDLKNITYKQVYNYLNRIPKLDMAPNDFWAPVCDCHCCESVFLVPICFLEHLFCKKNVEMENWRVW